ncbi:MCM-domain-containing protein [Neoconidiobolus thromboides FSU 785]|nr:MCM-domain-containing protein [Neoconidiobolus thromboides FSU 785]
MSALNYIATSNPVDENVLTITRAFTEFLNSEANDREYKNEIIKAINSDEKRLIVSLEKVRTRMDMKYVKGLLSEPSIYYEALTRAFKDTAKQMAFDQNLSVIADDDFYFVGITGSFGDHHVNPRTLSSYFLGQLVCLEGIVAKCSISRPKVSRSVHYCETTRLFQYKDYRDATNATSENPVTGFTYPTEDENGNPLITEFGMSIYRDHQTITVQEMPEKAPPGQLPRSIEVMLDDDLVDRVKPGDRVRITGIYKSLGNRNTSSTSGTFRTVLIANHVRHIGTKSAVSPENIPSVVTLSEKDRKNIQELATKRKKKVVDLLATSLMPSIYGHEYIKRAILLMLLGGVEKNLENGTHIRGDINVMLIGDPSTAKSQVLRYVLNMANLAVATTGRGSSGVGLTAAVTTDADSGERRLEAGAMVLADRGVVCIDEFDKMSDVDRVAIHEVMEQQTVTISKAGIHTSLNARCSVLAAANPIFGQYDESKDPHKNIALPDSLLSRFDLLFVVLDKIDPTTDRAIANHVLRMHRYEPPGHVQGETLRQESDALLALKDLSLAEDIDETEPKETAVYETNNTITEQNGGARKSSKKLLTSAFIKKYIYYAKSEIQPVLTEKAAAKVIDNYTNLRNEKAQDNRRKTLPITARTLETIIRLATATAKARLSTKVDESDVESAYELINYAMFKETIKKSKPQKKKKVRTKDGTSVPAEGNVEEEEEEEEEEEDDDEIEEDDNDDMMEVENVDTQELTQNTFVEGSEVDPERMQLLREAVLQLNEQRGNNDEVSLSVLIEHLNSTSNPSFSTSEVVTGLNVMGNDNEIMFQEDVIFFL